MVLYYMSMEKKIVRSFYRQEIADILRNQLGYLLKSVDSDEALEEAEGQLAEFLNQQLRRAYIAGHAEGAQSVIEDEELQDKLVFSPETDAIWAARKYEDWKSTQ